MTMGVTRSRVVLVLAALTTLGASVASAQPLGTFRWQAQPFCNVIEVAVTRQGGVFALDGSDDLCGAPQRGSVFGTALLNAAGTVGFGITIVTAPGAAPVHLSATLVLASLNGTWRDSAGNSGTFVFTPGAGTGGPVRPVPSGGLAPASVTTIQLAPAAVGEGHIAPNVVTGANVVNGGLTAADWLDAPRVSFASGLQSFALTSVAAVVRSITIVAPATGRIIVNASGSLQFFGAGADAGRCSLTTGTVLDTNNVVLGNAATNAVDFMPYAATQGFDVAAGSTTTIHLVCDAITGSVAMRNSSLTGFFVATS